jgi:hypothetical protein
LVCGVLLGGGVYAADTALFKNVDVTQQALAAARDDSRVTSALGTPIEIGWIVWGSIETQGISGNATLQIPITGPKKSGMLYVDARKQNGRWVYYTLAVDVDGELIALGQ